LIHPTFAAMHAGGPRRAGLASVECAPTPRK
jgi:hypothetical protein